MIGRPSTSSPAYHVRTPQKDYATAFGALQSQYGLGLEVSLLHLFPKNGSGTDGGNLARRLLHL
ncbi:hypothetical protein OG21DRAFT_1509344 [Imleria badia]|nr:hypothetical protein OG21DRAFT_1509344 [Imleria badia]